MSENAYVGVRIQGGLLPGSLLSRLSSGKDSGIEGLAGGDFGLAHGETVREAANRVWAYLTSVWSGYRTALGDLPDSDRATTLTRDRWLQILLDQCGYGRVPLAAGGIEADGKKFPVSHVWGSVPVHLLGARIDLDRRTAGVSGAAGQAPQSMVQELLNRSDDHLWAILSNGSTLRLLRDSTSLVGSAYVEFDLEAIFEGDLFSDFLVLFTLLHSTRVAVRDVEVGPASCWLEAWREFSVEAGSRALDQLRRGVVEAIETLGTGFLAHPSNAALRVQVEDEVVDRADFNHALLRIIYRLLFTFVAEDRGLLLDPEATVETKQRYAAFFSTDRLRRIARTRRGGRHSDRWKALNLVWSGLGNPDGRPELGLIGIGGLFEVGALDFLSDAELSNEALLKAVRSLSLVTEKGSGITRVVDYRGLDSEELGSIYETLLEYVPQWDAANRIYSLGTAAGNSRKTTGSYYTPTSLIETLLDSALDPVVAQARKDAETVEDAEAALLSLTVCDPACGSGHFLVGAARRLAKALAEVRTGDPEPPPAEVRHALRDVIGSCIYGVDLNPLAAELAKVSLWLEAMEPGRPLAFLDAHIKVGNALMGTTPALIRGGLPQDAFKPVEGDEKSAAAAYARRNKQERRGDSVQDALFGAEAVAASNAQLVGAAQKIRLSALSLADVHLQSRRLREYVDSDEYQRQKLLADVWCAAIVWPKSADAPQAITNGVIEGLKVGGVLSEEQRQEVHRLSAEYRFFHWHLEFPDLFLAVRPAGVPSTGELSEFDGGFDVVLGNPPWERVALEDDQYFDTRAPWVLETSTTAKRKQAIDLLASSHPWIYEAYLRDRGRQERTTHFLTRSGAFTVSLGGRLTTQAVFAELSLRLLARSGKCGMVLPTGVIADVPMKGFWDWLIGSGRVEGVIDFENSRGIFSSIHRSTKFMLFTANGGGASTSKTQLHVGTYLTEVDDLRRPGRVFQFPLADLALINASTRQLPVCRTQRDVDLLLTLTRGAQPAQDLIGWVGFTSQGHSHLFLEDEATDAVPLYEGKLMHQFDAAFASYRGCSLEERRSGQPGAVSGDSKRTPVEPRFWATAGAVDEFLGRRGYDGSPWILAVRDYARPTDERTVICSMLPRTVPIQPLNGVSIGGTPQVEDALWVMAAMNSFAYDWTARQRMPGAHFNVTIFGQTPVPAPRPGEAEFVVPRASLLLASKAPAAWSEPLLGQTGRSEAIQEIARVEVEAAVFLRYGASRDDVDYVLDSFPIVRRKDESSHGEYRTKRLILECFDRMATAAAGGAAYVSTIDEEVR